MHIRGFDGLRALAVLLVFVMHKTDWGTGTEVGYAGVWVFFLLSGFLIGGQLWGARASVEARTSTIGHELVLFWLKRAMRIFPAYYVVIFLVAPFYLLTGRDIPGLPYYLGYLSNFYFQAHPADFLTTWAHFWSLAVEEQFYILFAPLMLLVPSRHAAKACWLVVAVSLIQRFGLAGADLHAYAIYIDSLVNFGLLSFGVLLFMHRDRVSGWMKACGFDNAIVGWIGVAAVAGMMPVFLTLGEGSGVLLQLFFTLGVVVAAFLLMHVVASQRGALVNLLEWRPIAHLGRISYALYLYNDYVKNDVPERFVRVLASHMGRSGQSPAWLDALLREGSLAHGALQVFGLVVCFALLVAVASLSWIVVERPALRLRNRMVATLQARRRPTDDPLEERLDVAITPAK